MKHQKDKIITDDYTDGFINGLNNLNRASDTDKKKGEKKKTF